MKISVSLVKAPGVAIFLLKWYHSQGLIVTIREKEVHSWRNPMISELISAHPMS